MLKLLEGAIALDKYRNYARAAEKIGVSQPTLSRNIQELERQFSVRLFDRARNGVVPTEFGTLLLEAAKKIEINLEELKREITLMKGLQTGELTIGVGPLPTQTWMPLAISELLQTHPELKVRIITHDWWDLIPALNERRIDIGVGEIEPNFSDDKISIEALPHRPVRFYCRTSHPLTDYKHLTLDKITSYPLCASKLPKRAEEFLSGTRALGMRSENDKYFIPQIECQTFDACIQIVKGCDAVGLAPLSKLQTLNKGEGITTLKYDAPWLRTNYGILTIKNRTLGPAASVFLKKLREAERKYHSHTSGEAAERPHK